MATRPSDAQPTVSPFATLGHLALRAAGAVQVAAYRVSGGRWPARLKGLPVLLLTTTGRRTGRGRTCPVGYSRDGTAFVVIGPDRGWFDDLRAHPQARVEIGRDLIEVWAQATTGEQLDRLRDTMSDQFPAHPGGQLRHTFPLIALEPIR